MTPVETIAALHSRLLDMTADRDCWAQQASNRLDDCVRLIDKLEALVAENAALRLQPVPLTVYWQQVANGNPG